MSDPMQPPAPRARRGLKIALAISVALNLLIVGLVAGAWLGMRGPDAERGPALRTLGLGPFALALDREARADVMERVGRDGFRQERGDLGRAFRAFQTALRSTPFDRDAADAALAGSRAAATDLQARGHVALLDHLETLPPEARIALADRLSRALRRMATDRPER